MSGSFSSRGSEKIRYLFIDGGCLDSLLEALSNGLFGGTKLEIDYSRLAEGFNKVFYYDCLPAKKQGEDETIYQKRVQPKLELFNHLRSVDRFHVYEGTARYRDKRRGQEQKQVDIMIAVDMLTHSFRRNMHEATLLTGDLDFKPLIDALVQDGMYVSLWYPKGRTNYELVDSADSRQAITIHNVQGWFTYTFQAQVKTPVLDRPLSSPNLDSSWQHLETIKQLTYETFIYEQEGNYGALLPVLSNYYLYVHHDLEQLKFYVDHIHSQNVIRE
ncbi:MAG: NYN domain-containing protein [Nostoc sp. DedSLP03]|uniref:NYN domain-containing protein n=1 Tax=Nostoc sp. DedSLP03 TaxID=3075400 RepID=UPI002AD49940|nr:NYN domain-containing protein [Nostoc sp. DedSLP03]MDZ7968935.1 NYN domain-containing protein [Nostoc sp. DedSLP03]